MSDTPIYDLVKSGLRRVKTPVFAGDEFLTTSIPEPVARAIRGWERAHSVSLALRLAPFGLHPYDMVQPDHRRFVYREELTGEPE